MRLYMSSRFLADLERDDPGSDPIIGWSESYDEQVSEAARAFQAPDQYIVTMQGAVCSLTRIDGIFRCPRDCRMVKILKPPCSNSAVGRRDVRGSEPFGEASHLPGRGRAARSPC